MTRRLGLAVAVACAAALAYAGAVDLGFVWDDHVLVAANPALTGLSGLGEALRSDLYLGNASGAASSGYWRPVAVASYALNQAFGSGASSLHLGNVLLHAVSAALLVFVLLRRVGAHWAAVAAAVLAWALHPEHVETVSWISCRYDLLTAIFALLLLLPRWRPGHRFAAAQGALFLAGLLSKEGFLALAAVLLADDWSARRAWRAALPRWISVAAAISLWAAGRAALGIHSVLGGDARALAELPRAYLSAIATYAMRAVAPLPLTIGHPYVPLGFVGMSLTGLGLGIAIVVAIRHRRLMPPVVLFLAPLGPVALASAGMGIAAERYFYLPAIGLAWLAAEGLAAAGERTRAFGRAASSVAPVAVGAMALVGGVVGSARVPDWAEDRTLFTSALAVDPGEWQSNLNLGIESASSGRLDDGIVLLERARSRNPGSGEVASALAWARLLRGDSDAALAMAEEALRLDPRAPQAHLHLAAALHARGEHARERAALEEGVRLAPRYGPLRLVHAASRCDPEPAPGCEEELVRLAREGGPQAADATAELSAVASRRRSAGGALQRGPAPLPAAASRATSSQ